jgi:hypothetical protein
MTNKNIEKSLARSIDEAPLLDFKELEILNNRKMDKHDYITRQQEPIKAKAYKRYTVAISMSVISFVVFLGWFTQYRLPDNIITMDVNPSIEIVLNKKGQVLTCKENNEDGKIIVDQQEKRIKDVDVLVESIISTMISTGYISQDKNVIMVSVEYRSINNTDALIMELSRMIKIRTAAHNIDPVIISQAFIIPLNGKES